jgi:TonB family protein
MRFQRLLPLFLLSACATAGTLGIDPQTSQHANVTFAPVVADNTAQVFPQAIAPQLPSANRLAQQIEMRLGDRASVDVRLCVTPAGRVASAELARSSTFATFDAAVMSDLRQWEFAAQPGPDTLKSCEIATIVYRPRR